ncbi:MAG: response regulator transcription factor [Bacteroidia bacterium]
MHKILIIDKDQQVLDSLKDIFEENNFKVLTALKGKDALNISIKQIPDVILLDIVLQDMDGIEFCQKIRSLGKLNSMILIFHTERNEDYSQVAAFNSGADDYIVRPIKPNVLLSRINAMIKRSGKNNVSEVLSFSGIKIDKEKYMVYRAGGQEVNLPRKEFEILILLTSVPRKVFTRVDISQNIWGEDISKKNRTIDVHIRRLREKLGDRCIKTVKGVGYSFDL